MYGHLLIKVTSKCMSTIPYDTFLDTIIIKNLDPNKMLKNFQLHTQKYQSQGWVYTKENFKLNDKLPSNNKILKKYCSNVFFLNKRKSNMQNI